MKGINISCASQASTAIYSNMEQYPSSSSSQPSSFPYLGPQSCGGGRAIDRHNPIITDSKRVTTTLSTPCKYKTPPISPKPSSDSVQKNENKGNGKKKKNKKKKSRALVDLGKKFDGNKEGGGRNDYIDYQVKKSVSRPSDLVFMKGCSVKLGDYISPPESCRYLLHDNSHLDVLTNLDDPALKWVPDESKIVDVKKTRVDDGNAVFEEAHYSKASKPTSSSNDQVVDLRVSLHCKGCEGKVRKHLSRMKGVTSFNIDFAAKKVTVVGDVTPVGVLASISKVKHAQLWTPPTTKPTSVDDNRLSSRSTLITGS